MQLEGERRGVGAVYVAGGGALMPVLQGWQGGVLILGTWQRRAFVCPDSTCAPRERGSQLPACTAWVEEEGTLGNPCSAYLGRGGEKESQAAWAALGSQCSWEEAWFSHYTLVCGLHGEWPPDAHKLGSPDLGHQSILQTVTLLRRFALSKHNFF